MHTSQGSPRSRRFRRDRRNMQDPPCTSPLGGSCPTTNLVSLSPGKGGVVTSGGAELEWLDMISAEQGDLLIPVPYPCLPVVIRFPQALFVDVEVQSNPEPGDPPTVGAVVGELALVRVSLGNH